jgi:RNA polymerase sigma factor (sigma-70 family)
MSQRFKFAEFDINYIESLRNGDPVASEHFFSYFSALLGRTLYQRGVSREISEDIQQETFYRVLRAIRIPHAIQSPGRFGAFVFAVCSNVRREFSRREQPVNSTDSLALADNRPGPDTLAAESELWKHVSNTLSQMPEHQRRVLYMTLIEHKSPEEASRELNVARSHFSVVLHRARTRLRNHLKHVVTPCRDSCPVERTDEPQSPFVGSREVRNGYKSQR